MFAALHCAILEVFANPWSCVELDPVASLDPETASPTTGILHHYPPCLQECVHCQRSFAAALERSVHDCETSALQLIN